MRNIIKKAVILLLMAFFFSNASNQNMLTFAEADEKVTNITWRDLQMLDYKKGSVPPKLKKLAGIKIALAGYAVPLVFGNGFDVTEFLFVPDPMACQHVLPPPPNQLVYVKFDQGVDWKHLTGVVWLTGILKIVEAKSEYGKAAYELEGYKVGPFNGK